MSATIGDHEERHEHPHCDIGADDAVD